MYLSYVKIVWFFFLIFPSTGGSSTNTSDGTRNGGSVSVGLNESGYDREQITKATIGQGTLTVAGAGSHIDHFGNTTGAGINRDISQAQVLIKDKRLDGLDIDTSIQTRYVMDPMGSVAEDVEAIAELPDNMVRAGENALKMGHAHTLDMLHTIRGENDIYILSEVEMLKHYNGNYDVGVISNSLEMMYNDSIVQGGQLADLYLGGKDSKFTRIPFPGRDYDIHFGAQVNVGALGSGVGTDGGNLTFDVNPSLGIGVYTDITPRGDKTIIQTSYGFKNLFSVHGSMSKNKVPGIGGSVGVSIPFFLIPVNVSVPLHLDSLNKYKVKNSAE